MTEINELKSWIAHAEDDYGAAATLIRGKKPLLYSACFHAQQCAEKYMGALLIYKDQNFPKVHDLSTLNDLCNSAGIFIGVDDLMLEFLSAYAVDIRCPAKSQRWKIPKRQSQFVNLRGRFWD